MKNNYAYLKHILDAIQAVEIFVGDQDFEAFSKDLKTQSAVIRQIEVIGEAANIINVSLKDKYQDVPWIQIIATRNKLIHEYFGVDLFAVWGIVKDHLPNLKIQIQQILDELED